MARYLIVLALAFLIFLPVDSVYPQRGRDLYYKGVETARFGDKDFAFMYFRMFLRGHPKSELAEGALFSLGEYYFEVFDYYDTKKTFSRFIASYPKSVAKIFALAYLLEVARDEGNQDLEEKLTKEIVTSKQLSLLFSEFKKHTYTSSFSKKYTAIFFIDKVEIYVDEEFFSKISY